MSQIEPNALCTEQKANLGAVLDALLPASGTFPMPSETAMIEEFIIPQVAGAGNPPAYPGPSMDDLRSLLDQFSEAVDLVAVLERLELDDPERFQALWALAVFGYYSRPEVVAAIQRDHDCLYHGAPLPLGYAHVIAPWDAEDPLQMPASSPGRYIATEDVRRVDIGQLEASGQ